MDKINNGKHNTQLNETSSNITETNRLLGEILSAIKKGSDDVFTLDAIVEQWGIPKSSLLLHARNGDLPCRKVGKHYLFNRAHVAKWFLGDGEAESQDRAVQLRIRRNSTPHTSPRSPKVAHSERGANSTAEEYGKHLESYHWDTFVTLTTNFKLSRVYSRKLMGQFHECMGKDRRVALFWLSEKFPNGEGYHVHALITFFSELSIDQSEKLIADTWSEITRSNRKYRVDVKSFDTTKKGCFYLTKKLSNEGVDYDYMGFDHFGEGSQQNNTNEAA